MPAGNYRYAVELPVCKTIYSTLTVPKQFLGPVDWAANDTGITWTPATEKCFSLLTGERSQDSYLG